MENSLNETVKVHKKSKLLSILFSLISPGVGHIYVGKINKGLILWALTQVFVILLLGGFLAGSALSFLSMIALYFLWVSFLMANSVLEIKKTQNPALKIYSKWYFCLIFIFLTSLIQNFIPRNYETFYIPTSAMEPTLINGDYIFAEYSSEIERGEVVVFKYPKDPNISYVKRIIGLPGDIIRIEGHIVYVNNQEVLMNKVETSDVKKLMNEKFHEYDLELYNVTTGKTSHQIVLVKNNELARDFPETKVPPNQYFVMGDNRDFSSDSRYWGFVPRDLIFARPKFIYFTKKLSHLASRFDKEIF